MVPKAGVEPDRLYMNYLISLRFYYTKFQYSQPKALDNHFSAKYNAIISLFNLLQLD